MKYIFGTKINGTDETGIVDMEDKTILCLCTEEKAKVILEALEISSNGMLKVTSDSTENKKESEVAVCDHDWVRILYNCNQKAMSCKKCGKWTKRTDF